MSWSGKRERATANKREEQEGILGTGNFWQVGPHPLSNEGEEGAMGLKYTREDAEFMCSHTWLVLTCEIVS